MTTVEQNATTAFQREHTARVRNNMVEEERRLSRAAAFALTPRGRRALAGRTV